MIWLVILTLYAAMSAATFIAYGVDKRRAAGGRWRIRERTLHLMELLGGWPGALAGRAVFRHKGRKRSYRVVLALIVLAHAAAWGAWVMRSSAW